MLNDRSEVSRCEPANCSVCRSANEKPKPCTRPKAKVITQRRWNAEPAKLAEAYGLWVLCALGVPAPATSACGRRERAGASGTGGGRAPPAQNMFSGAMLTIDDPSCVSTSGGDTTLLRDHD